jgi:hypothetical protein
MRGKESKLDLAQDRDEWRTLVNTVTNLRVRYVEENLLIEQILAFQEGLCVPLRQSVLK